MTSGASSKAGSGPGDRSWQDVDLDGFLGSAAAEAKGYWEAQKQVMLLSVSERVGSALGTTVGMMLSAFAALTALLFANGALALWIGGMLGGTAWGFLVVGGVYFILFLILHVVARDAIRNRITLLFVNTILDDGEK